MTTLYSRTVGNLTAYTETVDVIFVWYVWWIAKRVFQSSPVQLHADTIDHLNTLAVVGDMTTYQARAIVGEL